MSGMILFFASLGVCALLSLATAFQMPDGFGNIIFSLQLVGGVVTAYLIAQGLPTWINPSSPVVETRPSGRAHTTRWPRAKGRKYAISGIVVYTVATIGGGLIDWAVGVPTRHTKKAGDALVAWSTQPASGLPGCLAKVYSPTPFTCTIRYDATANETHASFHLTSVLCFESKLDACIRSHLAHPVLPIDERQRATLDFAGTTDVVVMLYPVRGTAPPPPVERE